MVQVLLQAAMLFKIIFNDMVLNMPLDLEYPIWSMK